MTRSPTNHDVLERNVETLLETGGEPPKMSDAARARIRAELVARHGVERRARLRTPMIAAGFGLAATAAAALLLVKTVGPSTGPGESDDVSWLTDPSGGTVAMIGPRHARVEGAALIDVEPGKGPFTVDTARGRIEVLGTRFFVDAQATRTTAAVVRGEVKLATDTGEVTLHAGEQGIAEAGRAPTRGPAPRLSHLVSWAEQARREQQKDLPPVHHGTLFARDPGVRSHPPWGEEYPLPITKLAVDVVVENQVARVAIDQTFHNAASQDLEGVYRFAIPPDAALQRLAMYVDGKLTESAVVERMQARRIYEELVYRRVDPALLEWAGTGRLNLRVYPIPANQDKRLMLAYTQSLPKLYDDYTLAVPLPEVDQPVGELAFAVRVRGCAGCEIRSTSHKVDVTADGGDAVVSYKKSSAQLGDSLVLHVRDPRRAVSVVAKRDGDDRYLMVRGPAELAGAAHAYRPRTWVILDDVSASRDAMARRAQTDLIDSFMRELDENDRVSVVAFDVAARTKLPSTRVVDVDRRALAAALKQEGGVGATDFEAALDAAIAQLGAPDDSMIVYLGDGVITAGPRHLDELRAKIAGKAHFVGVGIGDGPDTQTLQALATATGGYATTIDLADDVSWRAFDLVAALATRRATGIDARLVDASGQLVPATVYLASPQLADGEELELVARLAGSATPAAVQLAGTSDGTPWQRTIQLPPPGGDAGYLPRLWAQRHIAARLLAKHEPVSVPPCAAPDPKAKVKVACPTEAELRAQRDETIRKDIVALGKRYFLLSRHTSLLVLENDDMYKKYGVAKGAGDTWAPYAMPSKIDVRVTNAPVIPVNVADDAELVRTPVAAFYDYGGAYRDQLAMRGGGGGNAFWRQNVQFEFGETRFGGLAGTGTAAPLPSTGPVSIVSMPVGATITIDGSAPADDRQIEAPLAEGHHGIVFQSDPVASIALEEKEANKLRTISTEDLRANAAFDLSKTAALGTKGRWQAKLEKVTSAYENFVPVAGPMVLQRFTYPSDVAFDDVTGFVPALVADRFDAWRAELERDAKGHPIDDAARAQLVAARKQLPAGAYRWDDFEIAVDPQRRIGWRRTTDAGLDETASFDGSTWTRRYGELGLDVTRAMADDDIALALAYIPVWIADPAHYARYFKVSSPAPHKVALSRGDAVALLLEFDAQDRLVAITDATGGKLVEVTWGSAGPTAARVMGERVSVGFTSLPIADAIVWAHGASQPGTVVELPGHIPAYWEAKLAKETPGSPSWQHIQRQRMVAYAATTNPGAAWNAFRELRTHGSVTLGDLALASGGQSTADDKDFAASLKALGIDSRVLTDKVPPLMHYLIASRAYARSLQAERLTPATHAGLVGALWTLRHAVVELSAGHAKAGIDQVLDVDAHAPRLRLIGASLTQQHWEATPDDIVRVWDAVAVGPYRNIARAQCGQVLVNRGAWDAAAGLVTKLVGELDLDAPPPQLAWAPSAFQSSRRGAVGWEIAWTAWRDRVLAGGSYAHVMALLQSAGSHPNDVMAILARAADLAGGDPQRKLEIAQIAVGNGRAAWAQALVEPMLKTSPTREMYQFVASLELAQGRAANALADLESAQRAGADEKVPLQTLRGELAQIIGVARQLAVQSSGQARADAVARAMSWGTRWREIDPGSPQIDELLGELQLAVGNPAEAWRQISTVIERDPMSGDGYQIVANMFEHQGRVAEALPFWHEAIVIDQTNPTPRLRRAQALIALGRIDEGDAQLAEIVNDHRWHDVWSGVVYQAKALLEQGKHK
jgi:tetratricopeptide (TPR) repeat protein